MVVFGGTSRFYSRNSAGKFQLDVQEIGQAFAEQRSIGEQLRAWQTGRISKLLSDEEPITLEGPGKLILHFIPAVSLFGRQPDHDWRIAGNIVSQLKLSSSYSRSERYNADGFLVHSSEKHQNGYRSYVQVFRNGCLEYGDGYILNVWHKAGKHNLLPSEDVERTIAELYENGLETLNLMGTDDPIYVSCSLLSVKGYRLSRGDELEYLNGTTAFDRTVISTPEIQISDRSESRPFKSSLLPMINSVWQANGYEGSWFVRPSGDWNPFRR
jgi:hypothetical protein